MAAMWAQVNPFCKKGRKGHMRTLQFYADLINKNKNIFQLKKHNTHLKISLFLFKESYNINQNQQLKAKKLFSPLIDFLSISEYEFRTI